MVTELGPGAEFDLIRAFLRDASPLRGAMVGPGDDAAVLGDGMVLSIDMAVEGVHFRRGWLKPREMGYRAATAALSDLAAMAALPVAALVAVAFPSSDVPDVATELVGGMRDALAGADAALIGGDVARSPGPIIIDVVTVGLAAAPVLRSGAVPGDAIWVTGALGGAAAAVRAFEAGEQPEPEARLAYSRPAPRWQEARWLADRVPLHAMIDLSDGLAGDAAHLAAASSVAVTIHGAQVPVHPVAAAGTSEPDALTLALGGGEDYELCFAAPVAEVEHVVDEFQDRFDLPVTRVGEVRRGSGMAVLGPDGAPMPRAGYAHFQEEDER